MEQEFNNYIERADELWQNGEVEDALELVETCLLLYPDTPAALAMQGGLLREQERYVEAVESFKQALKQDPALPQVAADLADTLIYDLEDPDAALGPCERGLKWALDPFLQAELHFLAGASLLRIELFERALSHLNESIHLDPTRAHAYRERGFCHFEMWNFEHAKKDYLHSLELDHESTGEAYFYLGILDERQGLRDEAAQHFLRAHEIESDTYPIQQSLSAEQFSQIIEKARKALPSEAQEAISNLTVWVHDYPDFNPGLVQSQGNLTPRVFGIYDSTILQGVDPSWKDIPGVILLFKRNIELYTHDLEELESEIGTTLLHELQHYLELQASQT